jgi:hypothetical protein
MTLDEVLRDESRRHGYSEAEVEECLRFARTLVMQGRQGELERELTRVEEAYVRLLWEVADRKPLGLTEELMGRN